MKGNSALPPEDRLLKFLVDNNADAEETVQCANCDQESNKKVIDRQNYNSLSEVGSFYDDDHREILKEYIGMTQTLGMYPYVGSKKKCL